MQAPDGGETLSPGRPDARRLERALSNFEEFESGGAVSPVEDAAAGLVLTADDINFFLMKCFWSFAVCHIVAVIVWKLDRKLESFLDSDNRLRAGLAEHYFCFVNQAWYAVLAPYWSYWWVFTPLGLTYWMIFRYKEPHPWSKYSRGCPGWFSRILFSIPIVKRHVKRTDFHEFTTLLVLYLLMKELFLLYVAKPLAAGPDSSVSRLAGENVAAVVLFFCSHRCKICLARLSFSATDVYAPLMVGMGAVALLSWFFGSPGYLFFHTQPFAAILQHEGGFVLLYLAGNLTVTMLRVWLTLLAPDFLDFVEDSFDDWARVYEKFFQHRQVSLRDALRMEEENARVEKLRRERAERAAKLEAMETEARRLFIDKKWAEARDILGEIIRPGGPLMGPACQCGDPVCDTVDPCGQGEQPCSEYPSAAQWDRYEAISTGRAACSLNLALEYAHQKCFHKAFSTLVNTMADFLDLIPRDYVILIRQVRDACLLQHMRTSTDTEEYASVVASMQVALQVSRPESITAAVWAEWRSKDKNVLLVLLEARLAQLHDMQLEKSSNPSRASPTYRAGMERLETVLINCEKLREQTRDSEGMEHLPWLSVTVLLWMASAKHALASSGFSDAHLTACEQGLEHIQAALSSQIEYMAYCNTFRASETNELGGISPIALPLAEVGPGEFHEGECYDPYSFWGYWGKSLGPRDNPFTRGYLAYAGMRNVTFFNSDLLEACRSVERDLEKVLETQQAQQRQRAEEAKQVERALEEQRRLEEETAALKKREAEERQRAAREERLRKEADKKQQKLREKEEAERRKREEEKAKKEEEEKKRRREVAMAARREEADRQREEAERLAAEEAERLRLEAIQAERERRIQEEEQRKIERRRERELELEREKERKRQRELEKEMEREREKEREKERERARAREKQLQEAAAAAARKKREEEAAAAAFWTQKRRDEEAAAAAAAAAFAAQAEAAAAAAAAATMNWSAEAAAMNWSAEAAAMNWSTEAAGEAALDEAPEDEERMFRSAIEQLMGDEGDDLGGSANESSMLMPIVSEADAAGMQYGGRRQGRHRGDRKECVVCLEDDVDGWRMLRPCGHACLCERCAASPALSSCPICRAPIQEIIPVYLG